MACWTSIKLAALMVFIELMSLDLRGSIRMLPETLISWGISRMRLRSMQGFRPWWGWSEGMGGCSVPINWFLAENMKGNVRYK